MPGLTTISRQYTNYLDVSTYKPIVSLSEDSIYDLLLTIKNSPYFSKLLREIVKAKNIDVE